MSKSFKEFQRISRNTSKAIRIYLRSVLKYTRFCWKYLEHLELLEHFRRRKGKMKQKKHSECVQSL